MARISTTVSLSVSSYDGKVQDLIDFVDHLRHQGIDPDSSLTFSMSKGDRPGESSVYTIKAVQQASKTANIKDAPAWGSR